MEGIYGCGVKVCNGVDFNCSLVGLGIKKESKQWNNKVRSATLQKKLVFEQSLQQRSEQAFDRYREERRKEKTVVREVKREAE